jgi:Zn-dependent protease
MQPSEDREQPRAHNPGTMLVASVFGVPVRFHFTFVLLAVFLIFIGVTGRQSSVVHVTYIGALFFSVFLHELGHVLVSRHYGIRTIEIVMFPIGGVARLERTPPPRQELWIALAGPAVNLLIGIGIGTFLYLRGTPVRLENLWTQGDETVLERILAGNLILAAFNLLPAFPMDGGRVLRSILALRQPEEQATRFAAATGRMLAVVMGLYGLVSQQYMLIFIAFFVYLGAAQEGAAAAGRALTQGVPAHAAMVTSFDTLPHGSILRDAANRLLATSQQDFPVILSGQVIGLLSRNALLRGMATEGPDAYIAAFMDRDFIRVPPSADLAQTLPLLSSRGSACALVMEEEHLLGLLTIENISEFLILRRFGMELPPARHGGG